MFRFLFCSFCIVALAGSLSYSQDTTFIPKGKFSGLAFGDYFYNVGRDTAFNSKDLSNSASGREKSYQAFQLRRIYFTYDYDIASQFTSRFRLEADQGALSSDGKISVFVKDAFLRWKNIFAGTDLWLGEQPTPAYDISEAFWGYRSLEKTIMDLRGVVPSRDLGAALRGRIDQGGNVNYWIMIADGSGNKPETDKYKRYYANLFLKPFKNVQVTLYGDYADGASITDPTSTTIPKGTVSHGALTGALFAGYSEPGQFNIGIEAFLRSIANDLQTGSSLSSRKTMGLSLFGWYDLKKEFSIVLRYDFYDPNTDGNSKGDARNYFVGGLAWHPDRNVSIIPNAVVETYESLPNGHTFDPSVTARITFAYNFY